MSFREGFEKLLSWTCKALGMDDFSRQCMVRTCTVCNGDTEFYCKTCESNLCLQCKEIHNSYLDTVYHDVVIYREKFESIQKAESCGRHPEMLYEMYCQSCELPVCNLCTEHRNHEKLDLKAAYSKHKEIIHKIRSEILHRNYSVLSWIQNHTKTCNLKISGIQSAMSSKATRLKSLTDTVLLNDIKKCSLILFQTLQHQKSKLNTFLAKSEYCEHRSEHLLYRPVQFFLVYKKTLINKIKATAQVKQVPLLSISDNLKKADVSLLLKETQSEIMKTEIVNEQLLKMVSKPVLKRSVKVNDISYVCHISIVTPDKFWVSDWNNLILTDTSGKTLQKVTDKAAFPGVHTVSKAGELLYIDIKGDVKIQTDSQSKVMRMERTESPISLHYCAFAGDILLGFRGFHTKVNISYAGIVKQYDSIGEEIQTLQFDHKGENLFGDPRYLTKNCNEDIIVSDYTFNAVVVVDSAGKHRFSYTGPPPGSGLKPGLLPQGICTDALSHILVVDTLTDTVQMMDKDGNFLSILLTKPGSIHELYGLAYDHKTHLLIVGRGSSECTDIVSVYRYIERQNYVLTDT
ncbi:tripartite motif-containing protein 2-like [Saccostrea cucullata]|uniref:tripartite motif-containing protein 2-like n=1 Tax=Saccostrea cuccullata TaxID=36930 RepID=UPI002ED1C005